MSKINIDLQARAIAANASQVREYANSQRELLTMNTNIGKMLHRVTKLLRDPESDITDVGDFEATRVFKRLDQLKSTYKNAENVVSQLERQIKAIFHQENMMATAKSEYGGAWLAIHDPANGKVLLGERAPGVKNAGQWGFSGGGVDKGETYAEAALREGWEEGGFRLSISDIHESTITEDGHHIFFDVFRKVMPRVTKEVSRWAWVTPHELHNYTLHKSVFNYYESLYEGLTL